MQTKKLQIPDDMAKHLGVDKAETDAKLAAIVESKKGLTVEEILDSKKMCDDYKDFTHGEMVALFMDSASEAGYLRFKMDRLMESGLIDMAAFAKFMAEDNPDKDLLGDLFDSPKDFL
jgi:hypothetical protein